LASTAAPHAEWEVFAIAKADLETAREPGASVPSAHRPQGVLAAGMSLRVHGRLRSGQGFRQAGPWLAPMVVMPALSSSDAASLPGAVGRTGVDDFRATNLGRDAVAAASLTAESSGERTAWSTRFAARFAKDPLSAASPAAWLLLAGLAGFALIARPRFGR
jgi:hypothetical protein